MAAWDYPFTTQGRKVLSDDLTSNDSMPTRKDRTRQGRKDEIMTDTRTRTMSSLEDRVALVTGSSRGIGASIARLFARQGAKVAVHGRDPAALAAVKKAI